MTIFRMSPEQEAHERAEWLHDRAIDAAAEREHAEDQARQEWLDQNELPPSRCAICGMVDRCPCDASYAERQSDRFNDRGDEWREADWQVPL